jgi:bifunctional DNase/RNase
MKTVLKKSVKKLEARSSKKKIRATIGLSKKPAAQPLASGEAWVELFPYGLSLVSPEGRPVLILKDGREESTLPVWMHPHALSQGEETHEFTAQVFRELGVRVTHCQINEINGHRQYAQVFFDGHPTLKSLRVRADVSMSFCLAFKARFYSTKAFMMRCRDVDAQMMQLEQALKNHPNFGSKSHPYVM